MMSYVRLSAAEVRPGCLLRRRRHHGLARRTMFLLGRETPVRLMLARAFRLLSREDCGFAVPSLFATACFGDSLQMTCPPARLNVGLADWISDGRRCLHSSDVFLGAGDWTPLVSMIDESIVAREAVELHACSLNYRTTHAYAVLLKAADAGQPVRRQQQLLDTPQKIDGYFERFTALYRAIAEHGVLSCRRLQELGLAEAGERDVGVAVAADGKLLRLPGGQHRTAIARVLNLPTMPVEARLLHVTWLREVMARRGCSPFDAVRCGLAEVGS